MSCFRSGLSAYGAMGRMEVILSSLVEVPSVMERLVVFCVSVTGPSHWREDFSKFTNLGAW